MTLADREKEGTTPLESVAPGDERPMEEARFEDRQTAPSNQLSKPSFNFRPDLLIQFSRTGHELIPLNAVESRDRNGRLIGKAPIGSKWRLASPMSVEDAQAHMASGHNVGVRLRPEDLVLDVDPRNYAPGDDPLVRLERDLNIDLGEYPTVITGSGGKHIYMRKPAEVLLRDSLETYQGLEFKTYGRQVVAPGSVHPGQLDKEGNWVLRPGGSYRWDDDPLSVPLAAISQAPSALIQLTTRPLRVQATEAGGRSPEELERMLGGLDPTRFREHNRWLELMMACHHATRGDGREEFISWSTGDTEFAGDGWIIGRRWDTLHDDSSGRRVTEKTLFKALVDQGRADLLPRDNAADDFDDIDEEAENEAADHSNPPQGTDEQAVKRIIDDWVWVTVPKVFVRRSDCLELDREQFKMNYGHLKPKGDIVTAIGRSASIMRKFERLDYLPGEGEFPDGEIPRDGSRYNIYRDTGVTAAETATDDDVRPFLDHMEYMIPDEIERGYVLDFLAMLIQSPGTKIHYALLIVSPRHGIGKGWVGRLITRMVGEQNVVCPGEQVKTQWNGWIENKQLALVDELKVDGLSMADRLKLVISEGKVRVEHKGRGHYDAPNRVNLICFTNHLDAIPIQDSDRRWFVAFSPAEPKPDAYYDSLFDVHLPGELPAKVKRWLLDRKVVLNPKGRAPMTRGKEEMHRAGMSDAELELSTLFQECEAPFDFDLLATEDLSRWYPRARDATKWLRNSGAQQHTPYKKGDRTAHKLWSLRNHADWQAKSALERIKAYDAHRGKIVAEATLD